MATTPAYKPDPRTVVKMTERIWSDEVGLADAGQVIQQPDPAYEFSNGRKFVEKSHYEPSE